MQTIKNTTKRGQRFIRAYENSGCFDLWDCYGRFSSAKARAEDCCREQMEKENGMGFKIISFNTCTFTAAWLVPGGLRVETAQNSFFVATE